MIRKLLERTITNDLVVIDSVFPQKDPYAFRNSEINEYFAQVKNFSSYTMFPMLPDEDAWFDHGYGVDKKKYIENKKGYLKYYPENSKKIHYLSDTKKYNLKLAYSFFLGETYVLLPFYEKNKIPFVFVLYPGGCFGLNHEGSDRMLKKIFTSTYFRGVIVTQKITQNYLLKKQLCDPNKIHYIYGGFVQFKKEQVQKKVLYDRDKQTFDICFVAAKYTEKGVDKGYDIFIEVAKILTKIDKRIKFHVIGGFSKEDIDVTDIGKNIYYYGYKKPDFLNKFYSKMDIFLGPGKPNMIFQGNFDGFPLGIDAAYCGVALFVTDDLSMNRYYTDRKDIILIEHDPKKIADKIMYYFNNPEKLNELAECCQLKTQELFDIDEQVKARLRVFEKYTTIKVN